MAGATKPGLILGRGIRAMHWFTARGVVSSTHREGQRSSASLPWVCSVISVYTHVLLCFWLKLTQFLNCSFPFRTSCFSGGSVNDHSIPFHMAFIYLRSLLCFLPGTVWVLNVAFPLLRWISSSIEMDIRWYV